MSTRLVSLQYLPRQASGWMTLRHSFGDVLTVALGPNGSGKTPLLKGIPFALGHPIDLPAEIRRHCGHVRLELDHSGTPIRLERAIEDAFFISTVEGATAAEFSDERTFGAWMAERLGIPPRVLADRNMAPVQPYMSVLLPMFWIDQDLGWRNLYSALYTHNFVNDQQEEVTRWLLGVSARHRAFDKTAYTNAKQHLESVKEQIAIKRTTLSALRDEVGSPTGPSNRERLIARREVLLADLQGRSSVLEALAKSTAAVDDRLGEAARSRDSIGFTLRAAERRLAELRRIGRELEAEVLVLETNEVAADAFRILCGNESCQFFRRPEESYGRRLLFLKDQLKDFQTSFGSLEEETADLKGEFANAESEVKRLRAEKELALGEAGNAQVVPAIDAITRELANLNLRLERRERYAAEEVKFESLIARSLQLEEEVRELRPAGGGRSDQKKLTEARTQLARSMAEWLQLLNTQNIPAAPAFDDGLRLVLGEETFTETSSISGSTRTRIVLAFHAAMMEVAVRIGGHHPRFLVLDAPKQHELHADDLRSFVTAFKRMAVSHGPTMQLVIGATEHAFLDEQLAEELWRPTFGPSDQLRFFGPPPARPAVESAHASPPVPR